MRRRYAELRRKEITHPRLSAVLLRYPLMAGKVWTMIHWQALRLLLKGTPVHPHPRHLGAASGGPS